METALDKGDLEHISEILTIHDEQGRAMLKVGWVVRMFFAEPWKRPAREAVTGAAKEYFQTFREQLRWARHPTTGHMHPIDSGKVKLPWEWVPDVEDGEAWEFGFHSGVGDEDASDFSVNAYGPDHYKKGPGYFEAYLPLTWFADHPGTFQGFVLDLARRLRPISGYGALGIQPPQDADGMRRSMFLVRRLAERFPGLDAGDAISERLSVDEDGGIKSASWLTVLGNEHVKTLGGLDFLKVRLVDDFPISTYDGGLMIQAGPRPQLGDAEANRWPQRLVTLAKVLKPIQCKVHYAIHGYVYKDHATMDNEATRRWMDRFDDK